MWDKAQKGQKKRCFIKPTPAYSYINSRMRFALCFLPGRAQPRAWLQEKSPPTLAVAPRGGEDAPRVHPHASTGLPLLVCMVTVPSHPAESQHACVRAAPRGCAGGSRQD